MNHLQDANLEQCVNLADPTEIYEKIKGAVTLYLDRICPITVKTIKGASSPEFTPDILALIWSLQKMQEDSALIAKSPPTRNHTANTANWEGYCGQSDVLQT